MAHQIRRAKLKSSTTGTRLDDRLKWYRNIVYRVQGRTEDAYVSTNTGQEYYILAEMDLSRSTKFWPWYNWLAFSPTGKRIGKFRTLADAQCATQRYFDRVKNR